MNIEIKKSTKPIKYSYAINFLEKRVIKLNKKKETELIWILEHPSIYTAGKRYSKSEILDNKIKIIETSRGGKITWHGPGQIICYFVIDLKKRNKDVRNFVKLIENTIIEILKKYEIYSFSDRNNIGIWIKKNKKIKKIAAIGIKIKKWIAYHGFSINIDNDLNYYNKIIPCGIKNREITNLISIKKRNYKKIKDEIISTLVKNLKKKVF
tara:strand:+ start:407 stop:1036 length:630 start_codon:yes stop_codon:yes gene_type:complete